MAIDQGVLVYDIPITQKSLYGKLRRTIRGYALPMTASCYIIPWSMKDDVERVMQEITVGKPYVIQYNILKFDSSDQKTLDLACKRAMDQMLGQTKESLYKRLQKNDEELVEHENTKDWERDSLWAIKQARKSLDEAHKLAMVFNMTDVMEIGFLALEKILDSRKHQVSDKFRDKNMVQLAL